jgi:ATP-dependent RNA helicase DeaD
MICRRGGIEKNDIGAIRIFDANTEFEVSVAAAESFAAMIKRPDKEDNIRIEALPNGPQGAVAATRPKPEDRDYSSKRKPTYKEKSWSDRPRQDERPRQD